MEFSGKSTNYSKFSNKPYDFCVKVNLSTRLTAVLSFEMNPILEPLMKEANELLDITIASIKTAKKTK
ncbi:MAG: hypothetical protein ACYST3_06670 [Planctomycetota bacterium]|jgi:hypothetical protein